MAALENKFLCGAGKLDPNLRRAAANILLKATEHRLTDEKKTEKDITFLSYIADGRGNPEFLDALSRFLTEEYGDEEMINPANLHLTAGATNGLSLALTLLLEKGSPVFVEEPVYLNAYGLIKENSMVCQPVEMDEHGMSTEHLEVMVNKWILERHESQNQTPEGRMYRGAVYMVPVFHNPTAICYSEDRCRRIVEIARKYSLLVICDDVYNFLYYTGDKPPKRLITYDNKHDSNYVGNVLSNGSFSKFVAIGVRVGWLEGPEPVINLIKNSVHTTSGGPVNNLGSGFITSAIDLGLLNPFIKRVRATYSKKMTLFLRYLEANLPKTCSFTKPKGGMYIWLQLPVGTDSTTIMERLESEYNIVVYDGKRFSNLGTCSNCVRLAIGNVKVEDIEQGVKALCNCINKYLP